MAGAGRGRRHPLSDVDASALRRAGFRQQQVYLIDLGIFGCRLRSEDVCVVDRDLLLQWSTMVHRIDGPVDVVGEHGTRWRTTGKASPSTVR